MENSLFKRAKARLAKRIEPFPIKNGVIYRMGQDNKLKRCMSTIEAKMVTKKLHEGVLRGHFATKITQKKFLDVGY
jgi:hypothetical protein